MHTEDKFNGLLTLTSIIHVHGIQKLPFYLCNNSLNAKQVW